MGMLLRRHNIPLGNIKQGEEKPPASFVENKFDSVSLEEEKKTYKKSDIFRMSTAELQELAASEGIKNAKEITGSELKTILVKHFDL